MARRDRKSISSSIVPACPSPSPSQPPTPTTAWPCNHWSWESHRFAAPADRGAADRPIVLLAVPLAACGAALAFSSSATLVWVGVAIWGIVNGVLDSTVKAAVTAIVARSARALAFGWLSLMRGLGLLVAGAVLGLSYDHGVALTVAIILSANLVALVGLSRALLART